MRRLLLTLLTLILPVSFLPGQIKSVETQGAVAPLQEPVSGSVLCPPGVYPSIPDDCLPLGPSEYLTKLAESGITLPIQKLPAYPPSPDLNVIPYLYFKANPNGISLFGSLGDAEANQSPVKSLEPGEHLYLSYVDRADTPQGIFYQLRTGLWIPADGGRQAVPVFQGQLFSSTPRNTFGWVRSPTVTHTAPGLKSPETGHRLYRYNLVQVFATQTANQEDWNMIGPDEWIESRLIAVVAPRVTPPEGVTTDRWIEVNLQEQTLAVYDHNQLIFATPVSTGVKPFWTRPGLFQIQTKKVSETMTVAPGSDPYYYLEDVPWTMYFDDARALHGAYWHNMFGYQMSHGCVNMSIGDSHWLFNWAHEGDYVYVYDPSGQTPTDPALYGNGAP